MEMFLQKAKSTLTLTIVSLFVQEHLFWQIGCFDAFQKSVIMGSSVYRKPHNNFQQASEAKCLLCPDEFAGNSSAIIQTSF